jgi:Lipocalin-like domain
MPVTAIELIGAWRLESWSMIYDDGRPPEYPLGEGARGLIMYTSTGQVSATLMRADRATRVPATDAERAVAYADSFAYAGQFEVRNATVFHTIEIATNPALLGVTSTRHIVLDGRRLTLSGPDFSAGTARTQKIVWQRVTAPY